MTVAAVRALMTLPPLKLSPPSLPLLRRRRVNKSKPVKSQSGANAGKKTSWLGVCPALVGLVLASFSFFFKIFKEVIRVHVHMAPPTTTDGAGGLRDPLKIRFVFQLFLWLIPQR